jgi:hypothetical protein
MLKSKFLFTFAALTLLMAGSSPLTAQSIQEGLSLGPSARPFGEKSESSLVDTDYYEYDAQLWAPYDVTSMDGRTKLQTGFYGQIDATYLSVSRPGAVPGANAGDFYTGNDYFWGKEIEVGFMSNKDAGWAANWASTEGLVFVNGEDINVSNPMALTTTLNEVELNRQFRQRLSNGGWVEPYIGVRYINLHDRTIQDFPTTNTRFTQQVNNSALGGQLGARYFRQYDRFRVGSDLSIGALYNTTNYHSYVVLTGESAELAQNTRESDNVIPALDLGVQLSYAITRDVSIRGGLQLQYIWEGIARADIRTLPVNPNAAPPFPVGTNTEDFIVAGFTFGVDWKR